MRSKPHPYTEAILRQSRFPNDYWSALKRLLVWGSNNYSFRLRTNSSSYIKLLLNRAQTTIAVALPLYHDFTHRPIVKQHPAGKTEVVHTIIPLRSDTQALRLIASTSLIQRRKSVLLVKKKAPSRSGFTLSMYVVLKTGHVNPNIHVRRY